MSNLGKNRAACQAQIYKDEGEIAELQGEIDRIMPLRDKLAARLASEEQLCIRLKASIASMSEQMAQIVGTAKSDLGRSSKQFSMQEKTFSRLSLEAERGYSLGQMSRSSFHNETFRSAAQRSASSMSSLAPLGSTTGSISRARPGSKKGIWNEDSAASLPETGPLSPIKSGQGRPQTSQF